MALDESMLNYSIGSSVTSLRFYSWIKPTLSIGRNQKISDVNLSELKDKKIDLVRRPTGGSAVLHDDELTYSIAMRIPSGSFSGIAETCRMIHGAISEALQNLKINTEFAEPTSTAPKISDPVCFSIPSQTELLIRGKKVVGSAQMRRNGYLMQHGSIPFSAKTELLPKLFNNTTCKAENLSKGIALKDKIQDFKKLFGERLGQLIKCRPEYGEYSLEEEINAEMLEKEKYNTKNWTERR